MENPVAIAQAHQRIDWVVSFMAMTDRFFFEILGRMVRSESREVATLAVAAEGNRIVLRFNPHFIATLDDEELRWALTHEVAHVVLHHIAWRSSQEPARHLLENMAADLAVNSLFGEYPGTRYPRVRHADGSLGAPTVLLPETFHYPPRLSLEQYLRRLEADVASGKIALEDWAEAGVFDAHEGWEASEVLDAQIAALVDEVHRRNGWGCMPGEILEHVLAAQNPQVPWHRVLRRYYESMRTRELVSTYKRPSRRFGYPWAGHRVEKNDRKLVAIDTSASVSDRTLARFLAETNRLAELCPIDLICWDTGLAMAKPIPWARSRGRRFAFPGRGGTNPQPVLDFACQQRYKEIILLTDGEFATPHWPKSLRVLWVIVAGGCSDYLGGGRVVRMQG